MKLDKAIYNLGELPLPKQGAGELQAIRTIHILSPLTFSKARNDVIINLLCEE